jgi:hypothetical protein
MRKYRESDKSESLGLFRMLLNLLYIFFLISLARGVWYYRLLPDIIPPLIPVFWPLSVPLPKAVYLLLPLISGMILAGYRIWAGKPGTLRFTGRDVPAAIAGRSYKGDVDESDSEEGTSLEQDTNEGSKASVENIRRWLSQPRVSLFLLQVIAVSLYSYVQEILLTRLTGRYTIAFFLSHVHGWVLALSLIVVLFSIMIRMYRKNHGLS